LSHPVFTVSFSSFVVPRNLLPPKAQSMVALKKRSGSDSVTRLGAIGKEQRDSASVVPVKMDKSEWVCIGRWRERRSSECLDTLCLLRADAEQ